MFYFKKKIRIEKKKFFLKMQQIMKKLNFLKKELKNELENFFYKNHLKVGKFKSI